MKLKADTNPFWPRGFDCLPVGQKAHGGEVEVGSGAKGVYSTGRKPRSALQFFLGVSWQICFPINNSYFRVV